MKTILSIFPAHNGNVNVEITRDSKKIVFMSKSGNVLTLLFKVQYKIFENWLKEKIFFGNKVNSNVFPR